MEFSSKTKGFIIILFRFFYICGRLLTVFHCRLCGGAKARRRIRRLRNCSRLVVLLLRVSLLVFYFGHFAVMTKNVIRLLDEGKYYLHLLGALQKASVGVFAALLFITQAYHETEVIDLLNRISAMFRLMPSPHTNSCKVFDGRFLSILLLKLLGTMIGLWNDVPAIIRDFSNPKSMEVCGVYLFLGSMLVLDAYLIAILVLAAFYREMGQHMKRMVGSMRFLEQRQSEGEEEEDEELHSSAVTFTDVTDYRRMILLCDFADHLDKCNAIYAELYAITKRLQEIFELQIFYYIAYSFMIILSLFFNWLWLYLDSSVIDGMSLIVAAFKLFNLIMLFMICDYLKSMFEMPKLLHLDVICSDIDERWDKSVEIFLGQRQAENLKIKALGWFELNNEFVLVILSAIVAYLFIITQFGLDDKLHKDAEKNSTTTALISATTPITTTTTIATTRR